MNPRNTRSATSWWLAVPAGLALLMGGVALGRASAHPRAATLIGREEKVTVSSSDKRLTALEAELANLRVALVALRRSTDGPHEPTDQANEDDAERAPSPTSVEDETATEEARAEFLKGLSDRVASEPLDAAWSREMEPEISRLLPERLGTDVKVSDVACRSSVCRATLTHPGSPRLPGNRISDFLLDRGTLGTMSVQFDTREDGATILYFERAEL